MQKSQSKKTTKKLVSIVIPTYNRKKLAERLLKSVLNSSYKNLEIIVIDDASPDATTEYLSSKFKNKKIIFFRNRHNLFAAGSRNVGLRLAKGEFVFFVDDDNVLEKKTIEYLVDALYKNPQIGEVGPVIYRYSNREIIWLRSRRNMWTSKTYHDADPQIIKNKITIETGDIPNAYMVRRKVLTDGNIKFRKTFGIMYEESDMAYRIKEKGFKIAVACNAKIYHDLNEDSFIIDKRRPFVFARNRVIFHNLYSENVLQYISIAFFWSFLFGLYYMYIIFTSNKKYNLNLFDKIHLSLLYLAGIFNGIYLTIGGRKID